MFDRTIKLIGEDNFKEISNLNILLVGLGGVGGATLEALIRSGVNNIYLIDYDKIDESNINRQIIATTKTIGEYKTYAWKNRCLEINNKANIQVINEKLTESIIPNIKFDYIIDAIDDINAKLVLMKYATFNNIKIISAMGLGKRLDAKEVYITTLDKTKNDPLAKKLRKKAKELNINQKYINVVTSNELPIKTDSKLIPSMIFVPHTAGIYIANYIILDIIKK